jgi:hypothetical protein
MRHLLAAVAVLALAGSGDAQQPAAGQSKHPVAGGYFMSNAQFGDPSRNNGAGSIYSDHAFTFGSTRSFFAPCGPYIGPTCSEAWNARRKPACPPCPPAPCEYK